MLDNSRGASLAAGTDLLKEIKMSCESDVNSEVDVKLSINGDSVKLNGFVQGLVANAVLGMLKSLKEVGEIESLCLEITKR